MYRLSRIGALMFFGLITMLPTRIRARSVDHADVQYTARYEFNGETKVEASRYTVQSNMEIHRLKLRLEVSRGTVSWSFDDPSGKVYWKGEVKGGQKLEEERAFARVEGEWTLKVAAEDATGTVMARWRGKG